MSTKKKKKKNRSYWQGRFDQVEQSANNKSVRHINKIEKKYQAAMQEIDAKINAWYQRIADNNGVSITEARKLLTDSELEEFKWTVEQYIQAGQENALDQRWMKELENASAKFHINRLEALKLEVRQQIELAVANGQENLIGVLADVYKDTFYQSCFEIQKGLGVGFDVSKLDDKQVQTLLQKPWSVDGENFSSKVWKNKTKLINTLDQELSRMVMTGESPTKAIQNIKKVMNTSSYAAKRLVLTEQAYFTSLAQKDAFGELDVDEYEIVATLDNRTSDVCQKMDGQHFPVKDMQPGVNAPPFHVFCRTTTCPYFDDEFTVDDKRVAKGEDGWYEVPANMTYPEWKKSFVDGGSKLQYLRNNLPRDFVDSRNIGDVISTEDLQMIVEKANSYGIRMDGFETYCGDVQVLDDILEHMNRNKSHFILDNVKTENIILNYDNVLGYEGDNSKIDIGAFAETRGKTITLNKFMFDDSDYLKNEYDSAVSEGKFAKGTSYLNVVDHEYGHIISKKNPKLYQKVLDEVGKMAYNKGVEEKDFIIENISIYASYINDKSKYSELISELFSMAHGKEKEFALNIFRKVGVLYENRS